MLYKMQVVQLMPEERVTDKDVSRQVISENH
jgi:hypothetical protein